MTGGIRPDACIDAVGMEAHGQSMLALWDVAKQKTGLFPDRTTVLREAIQACRKGGTVSLPGVYAGFIDKMPLGTAFGKGLTFKMGKPHWHRYIRRLLNEIQEARINRASITRTRISWEAAPK